MATAKSRMHEEKGLLYYIDKKKKKIPPQCPTSCKLNETLK